MPVSVPSVPRNASFDRSTIAWMPGAAPSIAGNASTYDVSPTRQVAGAAAPITPFTARIFAAICSASPPLDEDVERLHHAGADPGVGEHLPTSDRGTRPGEVLE